MSIKTKIWQEHACPHCGYTVDIGADVTLAASRQADDDVCEHQRRCPKNPMVQEIKDLQERNAAQKYAIENLTEDLRLVQARARSRRTVKVGGQYYFLKDGELWFHYGDVSREYRSESQWNLDAFRRVAALGDDV